MGWTVYKDAMIGYNIYVSDGAPSLPAPQKGTEYGPLVPGTQRPTDRSILVRDFNPCPSGSLHSLPSGSNHESLLRKQMCKYV
jgi:hypothetical protein